MITKELLHEEIDRLEEGDLPTVYSFILRVKAEKEKAPEGLLKRLKRIRIDAPSDFAARHERDGLRGAHANPDLH